MPPVHRPAVAGQFYPANPQELRATVTAFLERAQRNDSPPKAIIAPHAGYAYSGAIAASAYALLAPVHDRIQSYATLSFGRPFKELEAEEPIAFVQKR